MLNNIVKDALGPVGETVNPVGSALGAMGGMGYASLAIPGVAGYIAAEQQRESDQRINEQNLGFAREQFDYQKYATENALEIRLRDAARAGIHPLAALGAAPGGSISPVGASQVPTQSSLGNLALAGQDFSRAILATQTTEEKMLAALTLENMSLQNDYVRTQIMKMEQDMVNQPSVPGTPSFMPGQANGLAIVDKPLERTKTYPGYPHMEAGTIPGLGFENVTLPDGGVGLIPIPSADLKERIEDSPYEWTNFYKNAIAPAFGSTVAMPPADQSPTGKWKWTGWQYGWVPDDGQTHGERIMRSLHKKHRDYNRGVINMIVNKKGGK